MSNFTYDPDTDPLHPYLFASASDIPLRPGPLATRVYNGMRWNARYIGDVVVETERDWLRKPWMGAKALKELKLGLAKLGLTLGMDLPDWPPPMQFIEEARSQCVARELWDFDNPAQQANADRFFYAEAMDALRAIERDVNFLNARLERLRNEIATYRADFHATEADQ